jgi:hypothetical protein
VGALSYPQRPQHSKRAGARGVQVRAHVVLQAVQRDDVGITRDTNLSAERIDGSRRHTPPPQPSKGEQPAATGSGVQSREAVAGWRL